MKLFIDIMRIQCLIFWILVPLRNRTAVGIVDYVVKRTSNLENTLLYGEKIVSDESGNRLYLLVSEDESANGPGIYYYQNVNVQFTIDNNWQPVFPTAGINFKDVWTDRGGDVAIAAAATGELVRFSGAGMEYVSLLSSDGSGSGSGSGGVDPRSWRAVVASRDANIIYAAAATATDADIAATEYADFQSAAAIVMSADAGQNWQVLAAAPQCNWSHVALQQQASQLIAVGSGCNGLQDAISFVVFKASNAGSTWSVGASPDVAPAAVVAVAQSNSGLYIATANHIFQYRSSSDALELYDDFIADDITALAAHGSFLAITTASRGVFVQLIGSNNWLPLPFFSGGWRGVAAFSDGYAATAMHGDVYFLLSTDSASSNAQDDADDSDSGSNLFLILVVLISVAFLCFCSAFWVGKRVLRNYRRSTVPAVMSMDDIAYATATISHDDQYDSSSGTHVELAHAHIAEAIEGGDFSDDCIVVAGGDDVKLVSMPLPQRDFP